MHSLDINFLNDRPEYRPEGSRQKTRTAVATDSKRPLVIGAAVAVGLIGAAVGSLLFLQAQNSSLEQRQSELDSQLGDLTAKQKQIADLNAQTKQIKDETGALAGVFNLVKPWSAMMQEMRDRIPPGVQILNITQSTPTTPATPAPSPSPGAAAPVVPPPASVLQISGLANSFNDVNDFLLVLQKSNFLKAENTKLVKATLQTEAVRIEPVRLQNAQQPGLSAERLPQLPKQVEFQIETALSDVPASDLLRELDRKGAVGLVTRIEDLQRKGVIQP